MSKNISGGNIKTLSGTSKSVGAVAVKIKIGKIIKISKLFIIKSDLFKDDILLGLDIIKEFKLCQDENLKIKQNLKKPEINLMKNVPISNDPLMKIKNKYEKVFAKGKFDVGTIKDFEATIKLTENKYLAKKPYKCSMQDKAEIEKQIDELLKAGLIEESSSPNAAPVTLVYKKGEGKKSRLTIGI